jgi:rRNA-processing protein EBP2
MAKSKKPKANGKGKDPQEPLPPSSKTPTARISIKDVLQEPPSDDSSGGSEMPPESEWDEQALLLKQKIENGEFDHLLDRKTKRESNGDVGTTDDEESSIEEVDLNDIDELNSSQGEDSEQEQEETADGEVDADADEGSLLASEGDASDEKAQEEDDPLEAEEGGSSEEENETNGGRDVDEEENESSNDEEDEESHDSVDRPTRLSKKNHISSKALHVVTESMQARKREWPWAETFDVISSYPLPFDGKQRATDDEDDVVQEVVDIHDDLKREVAFYDMALAAVARAREHCSTAKIPFSRPEDFFAEMVKTDGTSLCYAVDHLCVL